MKKCACTWLSIPSSPATLLDIIFNVSGWAEMNNPMHLLVVDTHPKGYSAGDHSNVASNFGNITLNMFLVRV